MEHSTFILSTISQGQDYRIVSVSYCCLTNKPQTLWLKKQPFIHFHELHWSGWDLADLDQAQSWSAGMLTVGWLVQHGFAGSDLALLSHGSSPSSRLLQFIFLAMANSKTKSRSNQGLLRSRLRTGMWSLYHILLAQYKTFKGWGNSPSLDGWTCKATLPRGRIDASIII